MNNSFSGLCDHLPMPDVIFALFSWLLCWQQDFGATLTGTEFSEEATSGREDASDVLVDIGWDEHRST